ncbi:hypothetical protein Cni_G24889 [Canna indica]|uniref:RNase H type-1 domain-containing protein n=1 Tax=Canna indica TaxID=4628 RepID=A0AAQ3KW16_9LILI|nr:hypothetical protein Cni_G24889 [Canna indica]
MFQRKSCKKGTSESPGTAEINADFPYDISIQEHSEEKNCTWTLALSAYCDAAWIRKTNCVGLGFTFLNDKKCEVLVGYCSSNESDVLFAELKAIWLCLQHNLKHMNIKHFKVFSDSKSAIDILNKKM